MSLPLLGAGPGVDVSAPPQVVFDAQSSSFSTAFETVRTWSHTVGTGADRLLAVAVGQNSNRVVNSVTWNGVGLVQVPSSVQLNGNKVEWWELENPASGTANIVITSASSGLIGGIAQSFEDVNQTTPIADVTGTTGSSVTPSVAVTAGAGDLVLDAIVAGNLTATVGAGQTQAGNGDANSGATHMRAASSRELGAASVTMSWTLSVSSVWAISGLRVQAA